MKIFAHRGFSGYYPENTILAFEKALDLDIYGIELDVHKTKDSQIVVIHDEEVDRTYIGSGFVKDLTLKELQSLKSSNLEFKENPQCKIPTLSEVIELVKTSDKFLNIEIKTDKFTYPGIEKDVIDIIKKYNFSDKVILSSFNINSIIACKNIDSNIKTAFLYDFHIPNVINLSKRINASGINPNKDLVDKKLVSHAHSNNLEVTPYTANTKDEMLKLIDSGVDGMFTNFPDKLLELI